MHAQVVPSMAVVNSVGIDLRRRSGFGNLARIVRQYFFQDLTDILVQEMASCNQPPAALRILVGLYVSLTNISNICECYSEKCLAFPTYCLGLSTDGAVTWKSRWPHLLLTTIHEAIDVSAARVQVGQARIVLQWPIHHRRADSC